MLVDEWEWFLVLADTQHMTDAAAILDCPQSTLSRRLARLERDVGSALFERHGRRLHLNQQGAALAARARRASEELRAGAAEVRRLMDPEFGTIRLDFLHSLGVWLAPRLIRDYLRLHPHVEFALHQSSSAEVAQRVLDDESDLGLVAPRPQDPGLGWATLTSQRLALAVPGGHRLAHRRSLRLAEAADERFASTVVGFGVRTLLDDAAAEAGFVPRVAFESTELATVGGLVSAGLAVALLPVDPYLRPEGVVMVPLETTVSRDIGVIWRSSAAPAPATDNFRAFAVTARHLAQATTASAATDLEARLRG